MIEIRPLPGPFGAEIAGLDARREIVPGRWRA